MVHKAAKEFLFVDESGDPGFGQGSQPLYLLLGMYCTSQVIDDLRRHLTNFRYHHNVRRELKDQKWANKGSSPMFRLLEFIAEMTDEELIHITCVWLRKDIYLSAGGPHTNSSWRFRHYILRRLLEVHLKRRPWGVNLDVVVDRWQTNPEQQGNLLAYLRDNYVLRPAIANLTMVDSLYADPIQIVDIAGRLARRLIEGTCTEAERELGERLMSMTELRGGLYEK